MHNRANYWKRELTLTEYIELLKNLETWPHANTQALADQEPSGQPQEPPPPVASPSPAPKRSSGRKEKKSVPSLLVFPEQHDVPRLNQTMASSLPLIELAPQVDARNAGVDFIGKPYFCRGLSSDLKHNAHTFIAVRVHVNKDNLSLTPHPFKVVSMNNLVSLDGKDTCSGYAVFMRVHPCDVLGEGRKKRFKHTCRRIDATTLCVTAPSLDYSDGGSDDEAMREFLVHSGDDDDEPIIEGWDNARMHHEDSKPVGMMQWHLVFSGVVLDEKVLKKHEGVKHGTLVNETLPITGVVTRLSQDAYEDVEIMDGNGTKTTVKALKLVRYATPRLFWRIADTSLEVRKRFRTNEDDDDDDDFASAFMRGTTIS